MEKKHNYFNISSKFCNVEKIFKKIGNFVSKHQYFHIDFRKFKMSLLKWIKTVPDNPFGDEFIKLEIDQERFNTNKSAPSVHHIPLGIEVQVLEYFML